MSSSIFSSEHLRAYAALPRAERRWHAAIAAVLAVTATICSQIPALVYGASGCQNGTLGSTAVASLSDRTKVLFVGSSHVLFGVRPQRYSVPTMNLAATWLDYSCARRVVEKLLPRVPNLNVAVIEYDELPLIADLVPAMVNAKDLRPLRELSLNPFEFPADDLVLHLRVLYTAFTSPMHSLPRLTPLAWEDRAQACTPLNHPARGFSPGYFFTDDVTPPSYDPKVVFDALAIAARHDGIVTRNLNALHDTIALLRRRGVSVVLLRLPHDRGYAQGRPPIVQARWQQLQRGVAAESRADAGVVVLDWGEHPAFQPHDFRDNNHLNAFGADKLAGLLDARLRGLCRETL